MRQPCGAVLNDSSFVRVPSTLNQQDETITPATKANCHDNRSSALGCYPESAPRIPSTHSLSMPRKHFPGLNTSSDRVRKLRNLRKLLFLNIQAHPIRCAVFYWARSGAGIIRDLFCWAEKHTDVVCVGFVWRRMGTYVWPCVQGSALLNSKAWECVLLFTTRLWGLFDHEEALSAA